MESAVATTNTAAATTGSGWSKLHPATKGLIIVGGLALVGTIVYFGFIRKKDEKEEGHGHGGAGTSGGDKKDTKGSGSTSTSSDSTSTDSTSKDSGSSTTSNDDAVKATTTEVKKDVVTKTPTSTNITKTTTTSTTIHDMKSLPNGGKDCGQVRTAFDRDYDYVKCGSAWFTKSKPNPASAKAKGAIPNWKSLATNKIATQRLDSRYPKG